MAVLAGAVDDGTWAAVRERIFLNRCSNGGLSKQVTHHLMIGTKKETDDETLS